MQSIPATFSTFPRSRSLPSALNHPFLLKNKKRAIEVARFRKFVVIKETYGAFPTHHNTLANIFHLRSELSVTDS